MAIDVLGFLLHTDTLDLTIGAQTHMFFSAFWPSMVPAMIIDHIPNIIMFLCCPTFVVLLNIVIWLQHLYSHSYYVLYVWEYHFESIMMITVIIVYICIVIRYKYRKYRVYSDQCGKPNAINLYHLGMVYSTHKKWWWLGNGLALGLPDDHFFIC